MSTARLERVQAEIADAGSVNSARIRRVRSTIEASEIAARDAAQFRATDIVERARTALQRRGWMVCRASVLDGPADLWSVSGQAGFIDDAALIALAEKRGGNFTREYVAPAPVAPPVSTAVSTPAAAVAAPAPATGQTGHRGESKMETADDVVMNGAQRLERAGLTEQTVRDLVAAVRDTFGTMDGGKGFTGWPEFIAATGLGKSTLYNAAGGYAKIGHAVIDAFFDDAADGKLVVKAKWLDRLDPPEEAGQEAPLNGTKVPVVEANQRAAKWDDEVAPLAATSYAFPHASTDDIPADDGAGFRGKATPVPLERAAAEAARFDPNIEDDGFVTVRPVLSPPAGSAVVEGAGADAAALVGSAVDAGVAAAAAGDPADGAGEAPPVASPAQPFTGYAMRGDGPGPFVLPLTHLPPDPAALFANPSPHARQAGPNVVQHVAGGEAVHWRWKMRASMNMQLTSLLAKQAAAQDALDELNKQVDALRVLRALGDELPEPDPDFVAAMVRGSTEAQVAA